MTIKLVLFGLLGALLTACGTSPQRPPAALEQAQSADKSARRALREGDLARARALFAETLTLQQSLDNLPAMAAALINLSTVSHRLHDDASALALLDRVLNGGLPYPADMRAAAAFRKAVIQLDAGRSGEAESALALAERECAEPCALRPGFLNLRARLALGRGDYAGALVLAQSVAVKGIEKEEQANARRIAAAAESALGRQEAALGDYQAALDMDKELGLSGRIAEDLRGIASALAQLGRKDEAEGYARRAQAVSEAAVRAPR
ncbi:MAG: hypothetical protein PHX38_01580 [Sulfuricella sp.]|nr:hypothetical protein [Sulfuricella sp.]